MADALTIPLILSLAAAPSVIALALGAYFETKRWRYARSPERAAFVATREARWREQERQ